MQRPIYNPENDTFTYIKDGEKTVYSMDEMDWFDKEESYWKDTYESKIPSKPIELALTYPEAVDYVVDKVAQLDEKIDEENAFIKAVETKRIYRQHREAQQMLLFEATRKRNRLIKRVEFLEEYIEAVKSKGKSKSGEITPEDIERAKSIPITHYIDFRTDNKACCIWHNEKTPSMHYYRKTNTVHCFGCGRGGDVVDVIQELNQVEFREAIQFLLKTQ